MKVLLTIYTETEGDAQEAVPMTVEEVETATATVTAETEEEAEAVKEEEADLSRDLAPDPGPIPQVIGIETEEMAEETGETVTGIEIAEVTGVATVLAVVEATETAETVEEAMTEGAETALVAKTETVTEPTGIEMVTASMMKDQEGLSHKQDLKTARARSANPSTLMAKRTMRRTSRPR